MHLLVGQIVYTSLARSGFRSLASSQVPREIQQAFVQVAAKYWDTSNPIDSGYRSVYLHQLTREHTLFGWLYNDGTDDMNRSHVPYFICYYLAEPLLDFHLENIFACLEKGPLELIERENLPTSLKTIVIQTPWTFNNDFWSYQPARPGVEIPPVVRRRSHIALKQGELLDMFLPVQQEGAIQLAQTYKRQIANSSSSKQFVEGIVKSVVPLDDAVTEIAITPYQGHNENLRHYEQVLIEAIARNYIIDNKTLHSLQHFLRLTDEDIKLIETRIQGQIKADQRLKKYTRAISRKNVLPVKAIKQAIANNEANQPRLGNVLPFLAGMHLKTALEQSVHHNFVLAYRNSQLLLGVGIAASSLALLCSIYGLLRTSSEQGKPKLIPSFSSSVSDNLTEVSNVSQVLFNYGATTFAPIRFKAVVSPINQAQFNQLSYSEQIASTGFRTTL